MVAGNIIYRLSPRAGTLLFARRLGVGAKAASPVAQESKTAVQRCIAARPNGEGTTLQRMLAIATLLCAVVAHGQAQGAETVKIGIVGQFSGPFAAIGKQYREGIEAYAALEGMNVGDREMQVVYRDVGGANPAAARQAIQDLIVQDKVSMLGGFYLTPDAASAISIVNETKIPTVVFNAGGRGILSQCDYMVRIGATLYQQSTTAADWAIKQGTKRVYILVSDYTPGWDTQTFFKERFTKLGGEVVGEDRMALNTIDYAPFIERVSGYKPDAMVVFVPNGAPTANLLRALAARDLLKQGMKFIGIGNPEDNDLPLLGDLALGVNSEMFYSSKLDNPQNAKLVAFLHQKFGADTIPGFSHAEAFDGMTLFRHMLEAQHGAGFDSAAAIAALKGYSWSGPQGPMQIDPATRQTIENIYMRSAEYDGDKIVNKVIATYPSVRPPETGN
jgi:branched-chain amino acid transport system substrate-binding protein